MNDQSRNESRKKLTNRQLLGITFAGLVLLALAIAIYFNLPAPTAIADTSAEQNINPMPVSAMTVRQVSSISQKRSYTGMVRARSRSDLGFELPGTIAQVLVDEGDRVKAGDVLAELDLQSMSAQRDATVANLDQANSLLKELVAGPRKEIIAAARHEAASAKSEADRARLDLERRERLYQANAIAKEEYDQALFGAKATRSQFEAAMKRQTELENGTRPEKVAAQKSVVKSLQAALAEIDVNLDKAQLTAPFDGSITKRYMDPGGIANASVPVIRLVEQSRLEAWIGLPISVASHIEDSSDYQIKIAGKYYGGTVKAKLDEVDVQTRTRTVVFSLDQSASIHAITGELCEIEVAETVDTSGIWVPTSSLVKGFRGLWLVYAIEENESGQLISQKRDVEVVKTRSDRVLVRGTLNDGEQIVRDGVHRIANHQAVTIVDSIENIDSNIKSDTAR